MTKVRRWLSLALICLGGCATSTHVLVGTARPPISPDQVKIYSTPPAKYQQIVIIDANSKRSFSFGDQRKTDKAIERLKIEAAKFGANGILLQGLQSRPSGSVGIGLGSASFGGNSAFGIGTGTAAETFDKEAKGIGIYVEQE